MKWDPRNYVRKMWKLSTLLIDSFPLIFLDVLQGITFINKITTLLFLSSRRNALTHMTISLVFTNMSMRERERRELEQNAHAIAKAARCTANVLAATSERWRVKRIARAALPSSPTASSGGVAKRSMAEARGASRRSSSHSGSFCSHSESIMEGVVVDSSFLEPISMKHCCEYKRGVTRNSISTL